MLNKLILLNVWKNFPLVTSNVIGKLYSSWLSFVVVVFVVVVVCFLFLFFVVVVVVVVVLWANNFVNNAILFE